MLWKRLRHRKMHENDLIHDLLYATVSRDINKVDELIQCGIDPCAPTEDGTSPIHKAAVMETPHGPQIVSRMLSYGADPNVLTPTGLSPLHIAAMWGRVETINVLLDNGADVLLKDTDDMSALDYADEAEENRCESIDALTRYRSTRRRKSGSKSGYFLTKSRFNLEKIIGGDVAFSAEKETSFKICGEFEKSCTGNIYIEQETLLIRHHGKRKKKSKSAALHKKLNFRKNYLNAAVQTDAVDNNATDKEEDQNTDSIEKYMTALDIDVPDYVANKTIFQSCDESMNSFSKDDSKRIISSTFVEDQTLYGSALSIQVHNTAEEIENLRRGSSHSSESTSSDDSTSSDQAVHRSTPIIDTPSKYIELQEPLPKNVADIQTPKKVENIELQAVSPKKVEEIQIVEKSFAEMENVEDDVYRKPCTISNNDIENKDLILVPCKSDTNLCIPISFPACTKNNCNVNINICISNPRKDNIYKREDEPLPNSMKTMKDKEIIERNVSNPRKDNIYKREDEPLPNPMKTMKDKEIVERNVKLVRHDNTYDEILPRPALDVQLTEAIPDYIFDKLKSDDEELSEGYINLDAQNLTVDGEVTAEATIESNIDTANEPTIDYINSNKPVANLVHYFEEKSTEEKVVSTHETANINRVDADSSAFYDDDGSCNNKTFASNHSDADLRAFEELENEFARSPSFDETDGNIINIPIVEVFHKPCGLLAELSHLGVEYNWKDVFNGEMGRVFDIPSRILTLHDDELRLKLKKVGVHAKTITDRTRKIYQKHFAKIEASDHLPLKPSEKYEDYTLEMAHLLCGKMDLSDETGELLETEMALQFAHPEKHTWREGTQHTSFNYLLLDPRVTNNLPERAEDMTFLETFKVFVASVFFVGRGRKSRPYEHLEEATKYGFRPQSTKVNMIHDIWASGLGVVSVHTFKNTIPVEAFTREACILEGLGLSRLTNAKHGDMYGSSASWNLRKQRLLGIYLLMKSMETFLSEGEYQIRMKDLDQ